jgi:hypothetical protein
MELAGGDLLRNLSLKNAIYAGPTFYFYFGIAQSLASPGHTGRAPPIQMRPSLTNPKKINGTSPTRNRNCSVERIVVCQRGERVCDDAKRSDEIVCSDEMKLCCVKEATQTYTGRPMQCTYPNIADVGMHGSDFSFYTFSNYTRENSWGWCYERRIYTGTTQLLQF